MIGIVVGHNVNSQGARMVTSNLSEYIYNKSVAAMAVARLERCGVDAVVFERPNVDVGALEILTECLNQWDLDLVAELHFNASSHPTANGCEVWYYPGSAVGKRVAAHVHDSITKEFQLKKRGARTASAGDRPWYFVSNTRSPAILIEPFFGSNALDCREVEGRQWELANAIADGIARGIHGG